MAPNFPKIIWFVVSLALAWGLNSWRQNAGAAGLEAARDGDRGAAERWIDRTLREQDCELHEARQYVGSSATRQYIRRPDYVETFVESSTPEARLTSRFATPTSSAFSSPITSWSPCPTTSVSKKPSLPMLKVWCAAMRWSTGA